MRAFYFCALSWSLQTWNIWPSAGSRRVYHGTMGKCRQFLPIWMASAAQRMIVTAELTASKIDPITIPIGGWVQSYTKRCAMHEFGYFAYNAPYQSSQFLGIVEEHMVISPQLMFNTCLSASEWCLGVNVLPRHLHTQDTFPFWLLALSSMKGQWKMLVKEINYVSSPPPLSTNKFTKM